tara:strand:- start:358 stop:1275 length:918 start_codon:yes stop_codon:yes gene_type:complete
MKYVSLFLIILIFVFNSNKSYSEDLLTLKQQLDRVMEEVKDLNKAVFDKSFDKNQLYSSNDDKDTERFTSIDIRIYDIEKDIKNLTLQLEEVLFKLSDISNNMNSFQDQLDSKFEKISTDSINEIIESTNSESIEEITITEENTLGKIIISDNNTENEKDLPTLETDEQINKSDSDFSILTPEDQIQFALNQMVKRNYKKSKIIFEEFILNFPQNPLSGSAHFWLGKIYLFESNYRKAAIVFGEGVQKFPESIKAPEMYYELAKSLKEMNKFPESCKTLKMLEENYKGNKFTKDPEKIKDKLICD